MKQLFGMFVGLSLSCQFVLAAPSPRETPADASANQEAAARSDASGNLAAASEAPLGRWLTLDDFSFSLRYRNSYDTDGTRFFDNVQQKSLLAGRFKFDKEGKYFIGFRAESGRYFNWSYANISGLDYHQAVNNAFPLIPPQRLNAIYTALAADPEAYGILATAQARGWEFYIRDLYLSATPIKQLTLEFGAIPIERGAGSEITTFDDDGYISGERVRVKDSQHLYFDQIAFTSAYMGDAFSPNFFDRYDRLQQSNYRQILVDKKFGNRVKASVDYTWLVRANTIREAILAKVPETHVLDGARLELYQRTNDVQMPGYLANSGHGWAFTGTKRFFTQRFTLEGGFADVDENYGVYGNISILAAGTFSLNGDSYQVGKRFFVKGNVKLASYASLFGFYTHEIDPQPNPLYFALVRQGLNFGMMLDFKPLVKMAHIL